MQGLVVDFLIDTGASANVLSQDLFDSIPKERRPILRPCEKNLRAASGDLMTLSGEAIFEVEIDGQTFLIPLIVAKTRNLRGILGIEFLRENDCVIDVGRGVLKLDSRDILMDRLDGPGCCRILLAEDLQLEGCREVVVEGVVEGCRRGSADEVGILEPFRTFAEETGLVIPRALVCCQEDRVFLTLANCGEDKAVVAKGAVLARLVPIDEVDEVDIVDLPDVNGHAGTVAPVDKWSRCDVSELPDHLKGMVQGVADLDPDQTRLLCGLIKEFENIFMTPDGQLGRTGLVQHQIETNGARPIRQPPRRLPLRQKHVVEEEIAKMLAHDVIEPSDSPWAAPVVLVTKKDGTVRFCVDYRKLNQVTRRDAYPLPNISDCIDALSGAKWFSTLDLASGYWQVEMDRDSKPLTAFTTHQGLYQFKVLPFGLTNAPSMFERLMEQVLRGLQWEKCLVYIDDIIIFGADFASALANLRSVFERIQGANLRLKPKKCNLFKREVAFLGHVVTTNGVACDPSKIEAVANWETPHSVTEVRSFLGLASYYRRFIKGFASIASPMTALTEQDRAFEWTEECQSAFETLKKKLMSAPILAYPSTDVADRFILDTDASERGIGAVLSQQQDGVERVIAYASKTLNQAQRRYCTTYRELLAVVVFVRHFRHYLFGQQFTVRSDHASLRWLTNFKDAEGMVGRWLSALSPYDFTIEHRSGTAHGNADGLSRKMIQGKRRRCGRDNCPVCSGEGGINCCTAELDPRCDSPAGGVSDQSVAEPLPGDEYLTIADIDSDCNTEHQPSDEDDDPPGQGISHGEMSAHDDCPSPTVNWCSAYSNDDLKQMQQNDPDLARIVTLLHENTEPPSRLEQMVENEVVRALCAQWPKLTLKDGLLYRTWYSKHCGSREILQLVTPRELRNELFSQIHCSRVGGHLGISKTLARVRRRFYWPNCKADIQRWCQQCSSCAQVKPGPRHKTKLQQFVASAPLDCVAIDLLGELPETENGNKYILVITDYFTKWTQSFALPNMTAQTVADKIMTEFITFFGVPRQLHSDQGRQFEANLFQEVCRLLGIDKTRTTPYRPQSDGMVERFNRTIQQMLKHFVNDNRDDWDDHLPYLMMAYRASQHDSTLCSPNLLMLGREIPMPVDVMVGCPPSQRFACQIDYVEWLQDSIARAYAFAQHQLRKAAQRQKRAYDLKSRDITFRTGQFVWRWYPPKANQKLGKAWTGPFRIMDRPTAVNAVIRYEPKDRDIRVHIDHLKAYHGDTPAGWTDFEDSDNDGLGTEQTSDSSDNDDLPQLSDDIPTTGDDIDNTPPLQGNVSVPLNTDDTSVIRRSRRNRRPPDRLDL